MSNTAQTQQYKQAGMVSIMVTMIMMLVITLIVIGFAQVTRRNQREALDRQLSTQAYYAAESGVNDSINWFSQPVNQGVPIDTTGNCGEFMSQAGLDGRLNDPAGVKYTCLMVNSIPPELDKSPLESGPSSSIVWNVENNSGLAFTGLNFVWSSNGQSTGTNCSHTNFPPATTTAWGCRFGILRVDLVEASTLSGTNLENNTGVQTIFMVPSGTNTNAPYPSIAFKALSGAKANIVPTTCSTNANVNQCAVRLTGLTSPEYYVRLTMLYQRSDAVSLSACDLANPCSGVSPRGGVKFKNGQAVIDATGKAQDELRRVQVRIPLIERVGSLPNFGVQSTDSVCKQLTAFAGFYQDDSVTDPNCLP